MKIGVAMSGGVDSSVAAALLKKEGYEVIGLTMLFTSSEEAAEAAGKVARFLKIPHHVIDFREIFEERVVSDFCRQYGLGKTPNPCVSCNQFIKFGVLRERAKELGVDAIATGHYARIEKRMSDGRFLLKKGVDRKRDQSYFLYRLDQEQLGNVVFPLGAMTKYEVRKVAKDIGLPAADRRESREICFITDNDYPRFLREHCNLTVAPGLITDKQGNVLGKHNGIINYTIGQRKGLGISSKEPLYVVDINRQTNTVVVGSKQDTYAGEFIVSDLNWLAFDKTEDEMNVEVKIRYLHPEAKAVVTPVDSNRVGVKFAEPQMAITPGQSAVFYNGDLVVGGGIIEQVLH
ncbi:MAG: tRNA 2-thiouridine(34) synthase MnmA [Dehalococcoidales bacterium]|nr:tRNA 2-thiouridine(34) synthase MnmA [Dehalococcoidales bacterium]